MVKPRGRTYLWIPRLREGTSSTLGWPHRHLPKWLAFGVWPQVSGKCPDGARTIFRTQIKGMPSSQRLIDAMRPSVRDGPPLSDPLWYQ